MPVALRPVPVKVIATAAPEGSLSAPVGAVPTSGAPLTLKHLEQTPVRPSRLVTRTSRAPVTEVFATVKRRLSVVLVVMPCVLSASVVPELAAPTGAALVVIPVSGPVPLGSSTSILDARSKLSPVSVTSPDWPARSDPGATAATTIGDRPPAGDTVKQVLEAQASVPPPMPPTGVPSAVVVTL